MVLDYKSALYYYMNGLSRYIDKPEAVRKNRYYRLLGGLDYRHMEKIYDVSNSFVKDCYPTLRERVVHYLGEGYIVILATMLNASVYQKDNFDNYSAIIDDLASVKIGFYREEFNKMDQFLNNIFLKSLLSNPHYKDMPNFRKFMIDAITNLSCKNFSKVSMILKQFKKYEYRYDSEYVRDIADLKIKSILENGKDKTFFANLLLEKEGRFSYINEKLCEIEDNYQLRKNIFSYIKKLKANEMFLELSENSDKDSFITCMEMVFDSDSYVELVRKLNALLQAQKRYVSGDKKEAFDIIKNLNTSQYKEVFLGDVVSYPSNCMNMVSKPDKIIDRMKVLYSRIDSSTSWSYLDEVHDNANSIVFLLNMIKGSRSFSGEKAKQKIK